jgi:hypothetical protein
MLLPDAALLKITEQAHLSKESLLHLTWLFQQWHALGDSDNLLPPSVDGGKRGHHAAATTTNPKPNRKGTRTCRDDSQSRTGRSDGAHSSDSFSNTTKESE